MCQPNFTLFKTNTSKIGGLGYEFHLKSNMLIELCACNYWTNNGLVNGAE
jgi:hypothetical protein